MSKLVKICANRILFFTFLAIILALLTVYGFYSSKFYISIVCISFFVCLVIYSIIQKSKVLFVLCLLSFLIFSVYGFCVFNNIENIKIDTNATYDVTGYVPSRYFENENSYTIKLENCTISYEGKALYKNLNINFIYVGENYTPSPGDIIKFKTTLNKEKLFSYGEFNRYNIPYGIYFTAVYFDDDLQVIDNKINLRDTVNSRVKEVFTNSLDTKSSSLAFAVTFGDKSLISSSVSNGFRYSGLAHILAVSGLHTTILFTILAFLLSKVKFLDRKATAIIISIFLIVYAYFCSFSPSIIRACIMCIMFYLSLLTTHKPDALNTLGLSGIIILLFNPLDIFTVGFCLSFACMFGIILLTKALTIKTKTPNKLLSILALTTATQIATLPFIAKYFGYLSFVGFITNMLLLPLFTLLFSIIIVLAFVSLIVAPTHILGLLSYGLNAFIDLSVASSNLDFLIFDTLKFGVIGILAYLILLFAISNKFFIKKTTKAILCATLLIIISVSCVYSSIPKINLNTSYSLSTTQSSHYFKLNKDNLCFINPFIDSQSLYETKTLLNNKNEKCIKNLIVTKYMKITLNDLKEFNKDVKIINVYLPTYLYDTTKPIIVYLEHFTNVILIDDLDTLNIGTDAEFILTTSTSGYVKYIINNKQYITK